MQTAWNRNCSSKPSTAVCRTIQHTVKRKEEWQVINSTSALLKQLVGFFAVGLTMGLLACAVFAASADGPTYVFTAGSKQYQNQASITTSTGAAVATGTIRSYPTNPSPNYPAGYFGAKASLYKATSSGNTLVGSSTLTYSTASNFAHQRSYSASGLSGKGIHGGL
jgi:hypothetical protein